MAGYERLRYSSTRLVIASIRRGAGLTLSRRPSPLPESEKEKSFFFSALRFTFILPPPPPSSFVTNSSTLHSC